MNDVRVVFSKWGDLPHWEFDALRLGEDEHGVWLGAPAGTPMARPGVAFTPAYNQVAVVPRDAPFQATFYAPGAPCAVYVDICTPPVWRDHSLHLVDLDLDVIKGWTGRVWVDDEDEFADHRVRFDYPPEIVELAVSSCEEVRRAVECGAPPYDPVTSAHWLTALANIHPPDPSRGRSMMRR